MLKQHILKYFILPFFFLLTISLHSQEPKKYPDGRGGWITLPLGALSFADEVYEFKRGNPDAITEACDSVTALGPPDFMGIAENFTSLGCGGTISLRFVDNALVNIPGPDLFVFEVGKYVETTRLYVSKNGVKWINVGTITGGTTSVDIGDSVKKGEVFHYVKLEDMRSDCKGSWPGADIDAVAAIGSGKQITISSAVLYKFDKYELIPEAKNSLDSIVTELKTKKFSEIIIEGHTDNIGVESYNQTLSERRAQSVKKYIIAKLPGTKITIKTEGFGSTLPAASNATKEGQDKNRRVTLILIP